MRSQHADGCCSRRDAVRSAVAALLPASLLGQGQAERQRPGPAADSLALRLRDPYRAGRPRTRVTADENDPFIVGVEGQLRCTCGCNLDVYTCRTTDFTCTVSPAMHREVVALAEDGRSAQEILDAFVAKHGEVVLMAPRKEGFNIAAYVVPGIAIAGVGALLLWVLSRRTQGLPAAASGGVDLSALSQDDAARLEAELRKLES